MNNEAPFFFLKKRNPERDAKDKLLVVLLAACSLVLSGTSFAQEPVVSEPKAEKSTPATAVDLKTLDPKDPQSPGMIKRAVDQAILAGEYDAVFQDLEGLLKKGFAESADVYFSLAYVRSRQLEAWKKDKNWEGVYDKGPVLKKEISDNLTSAEKFLSNRPELLLSIKFLRWQQAAEEESESAANLFEDLIKAAQEAPAAADVLALIKKMGDDLAGLEDKAYSRRLYEIYGEKLKSSSLSGPQLKAAAEDFLRQKNIYLSKALYEAYLAAFSSDPAALAKELVLVADRYAHSGTEEALDPVYAESLYQKAFELKGAEAFDSSSQYRRAYNLERMKEFVPAVKEYEQTALTDADPVRQREEYFRTAVLRAYALKDIPAAIALLEKVKTNASDRLTLSALYQLGLLSQWTGALDKAKVFYQEFMTQALAQNIDVQKDELSLLCAQRLSEMEDKQPFPYGLNLFLEGTFGPRQKEEGKEGLVPAGLNVDLTGRPPKDFVMKNVVFDVTTSVGKTGCLVPAYSYEWSGETGAVPNIPNVPSLTTHYASPGIKVIHIAVVGNAGLEGVGFDMVQVAE